MKEEEKEAKILNVTFEELERIVNTGCAAEFFTKQQIQYFHKKEEQICKVIGHEGGQDSTNDPILQEALSEIVCDDRYFAIGDIALNLAWIVLNNRETNDDLFDQMIDETDALIDELKAINKKVKKLKNSKKALKWLY